METERCVKAVDVCLVITAGSDKPSTEPGESTAAWVIAISVIIVVVLVAVLIGVIRKRAHGTTWFPEGFCALSRSSVFDSQRTR